MAQKKTLNIAVLPGDGIGPEVVGEAVKVLQAFSDANDAVTLHFEQHKGGAGHYRDTGVVLDDAVFDACAAADAILFGAAGYYDVRLPDGTEVEGGAGLSAALRPEPLRRGASHQVLRGNCHAR